MLQFTNSRTRNNINPSVASVQDIINLSSDIVETNDAWNSAAAPHDQDVCGLEGFQIRCSTTFAVRGIYLRETYQIVSLFPKYSEL